jgi:RNA polymerase sigma-70 factor (ECF subfamily)
MANYQAGDLCAFDALYGELAHPLGGYLFALTRNRTTADDLLQETFLQIHRSRHTYEAGRPVRPWAFGVARYVCLMDRRSRKSREDRETQADDEAFDLPVPSLTDDWLNRDHLRRLVGVLKPAHREVVLLHHVWGLSFKEIGSVLGIRETTAKVRAHRALQRLKSEATGTAEGAESITQEGTEVDDIAGKS